jgi:hypothetical protein
LKHMLVTPLDDSDTLIGQIHLNLLGNACDYMFYPAR